MPRKSLRTRALDRIRRDFKRYYWLAAPSQKNKQRFLFIFGTQRSGTTMLLHLFEKDLRSRTFGEYSAITGIPQKLIRLKPLNDVRNIFSTLREPLVVSKPIVESHRTHELLDFFTGSKALWAYRDFHDVVSSNIKLFQDQVRSCRAIVDKESGNWRSEVVPDKALELIRKHYHENMAPHDAAALFWFARNCLYFDQDLQALSSLRLWKYEDFVENPVENIEQIYAWLEMAPPSRRLTSFISPRSVGLGRNVVLNEEIESSCQELQDRLDNHYNDTVFASRQKQTA